MPNRILKESICTSETIDSLSAFEETFFYRLIVNCDDYGRLDARPSVLKAKLFPLKDVRVDTVSESLSALVSAGTVDVYEVDGKPYLQMSSWGKHQTTRATKSKYPAPPAENNRLRASESNGNQLHADESKRMQMPPYSYSNSGIGDVVDPRAREGGIDDDLPFDLSQEDVRQHNETLNAVEAECRRVGMPFVSQMDFETAVELATMYTLPWLLQAIARAKERGKPNWGFIKGILKRWQEAGGPDDGTPPTQPALPGPKPREFN